MSDLEAIRSELARIRALEEKATRGPWQKYGPNEGVNPLWGAQIATLGYGVVLGPAGLCPQYDHHPTLAECEANGDLLASARTDVPRLVRALERAVKTLDVTTCAPKQHIAAEDAANAAVDNARQALADIARLLEEE